MRRTFFWLSVVLVIGAAIIAAATAISLASAQTTQTPQMAYLQYRYFSDPNCCPPGGGACNAFCPDLGIVTLVTPFGGTNGTQPTWSADGTKIAFNRNYDIYVADASGANPVNVTNTANNRDPAWSPDGARIAFRTTRDGHPELYLMNPDGSNVVRLTYNVAPSVGRPAWSRDSARIAFNCQNVDSGNDNICAINPDGAGFARLNTNPASDSGPTWSPDGMSIAFSTTQYGPNCVIAVMNADGSGVSQVGAGVQGSDPAWSPDGAEIAFDVPGNDGNGNYTPAIYTVKADGTGVALFVSSADEPAWMPAHVPVATFKFTCIGLTCNFDAFSSKDLYGTITSYAWNFGDGTSGAGVTTGHTYVAGDTYSVTLTVTDNNGAMGTKIQTIADRPVASITFACSGLTCNFDGSGSKDPYATIASYAWNFGDGTSGAGVTTGHTYAAGSVSAYNVTLTVTDSSGTSSSQSRTVMVNSPPVASFSFSCNRLTCGFDASGSYDPDGSITTWTWNLGDGTKLTGNYPQIGHMYPAPGTYTVTLTVTDSGGATGFRSNNVRVPSRK